MSDQGLPTYKRLLDEVGLSFKAVPYDQRGGLSDLCSRPGVQPQPPPGWSLWDLPLNDVSVGTGPSNPIEGSKDFEAEHSSPKRPLEWNALSISQKNFSETTDGLQAASEQSSADLENTLVEALTAVMLKKTDPECLRLLRFGLNAVGRTS